MHSLPPSHQGFRAFPSHPPFAHSLLIPPYTCIHVHQCPPTSLPTLTHAPTPIYTHAHTHAHTQARTCTCTHTRARMHTCTRSYTHTHTHTHAHRMPPLQKTSVHVWLVAHPRQQQGFTGEAPGLYEISGSANFANKCDNGIVIFRWGHLGQAVIAVVAGCVCARKYCMHAAHTALQVGTYWTVGT